MSKPKHISPKLLTASEGVLIETRTSGIKHMTGATFSILITAALLILAFWDWLMPATDLPYISQLLADATYGRIAFLAFVAIAALFFLNFVIKYLRWTSMLYVLTNERVITKKGILGRNYEDMPLHMITNIGVSQSAIQRFLGYGTVVFSSQSGTRDDVVWKSVPEPVRVRRQVQEAMDKRQ